MTVIDTATDWSSANQRHLVASLGVVRALLAAHAAPPDEAPEDEGLDEARARLEAAELAMPAPSAIDTLCAAFDLSSFERLLVLLCAGVDLEGAFPLRIAAAHGDPASTRPTFGLAMAALPGAHWSALAPSGALRRWRMVDVHHGESLTSGPLWLDERILHYLTGVQYLDDRLAGLLSPIQRWDDLPPSLEGGARRVAGLLSAGAGAPIRPLIQLHGPDRSTLLAVAAAAASELRLQPLRLRASDVPAALADREAMARLLEREAVLGSAAFVVDVDDLDGPEATRAARALAESVASPILMVARESVGGVATSDTRVLVERPGADEQRALWRAALGPAAAALNGWMDPVVAQFRLAYPAMQSAGAEVLARLREGAGAGVAHSSPDLEASLWESCREQARTGLDDMAQRIPPLAGWNDIVLPETQLATLREVATQVRHRVLVYEDWGFARASTRGLGISALFAGPSGTGKTMAAEVLAGDLRLDLYRIDLSQVVSKYIGETEKNLRRVFDAAEEGGAILLFDEADALFGKRSDVKDSHDRYANIEVSYLLQRMEAYRGLAILTTNNKSALDTAFLRRIRFVVEFRFPDAVQRAEIWRRVFPADTPVDGVDPERLARLNVAGGNIRNIALNAAFLAADEGVPVRMPHLLRAVRTEYTKLERPLTDAEIGGWA